MRYKWLPLILIGVFFARASAAPATQEVRPAEPADNSPTVEAPTIEEPSADEKAIRDNAAKYVEAYNRRDSATMAKMWSPEAVYLDPRTGEGIVGRDAIKESIDQQLAGSEDSKLAVTVESVDFISPNVAVEKGTAHVTYGNHEPEDTVYTAVHVKRDGNWLLDRISEEEVPAPPPSNYEHLQELEWMIGSWIDQDENATIQTDCEWTKNRNFMTRSFAVVAGDEVASSGMEIVGWDAAAKQIRSWVFDSDGGFSEGTWTHKDNRWAINRKGVLPDGGKTSAVNIIKTIDNDSFTWQSIQRDVDGEMLPNVDEVLIVRKPTE